MRSGPATGCPSTTWSCSPDGSRRVPVVPSPALDRGQPGGAGRAGRGRSGAALAIQVQLGRALWVDGDGTRSVEAYEEALRIAPAEAPLARIRALAGLGQDYMLLGWHRGARDLCRQAIELARSVGAREQEGHALNTLGTSLGALGHGPEALEAIDAGLAIAIDLRLPTTSAGRR